MPATQYEVRNQAAWITLDRPENRNALSAELVNELYDHLQTAVADDAVRAIVITGNGPAFCAGADLKSPPGASISGGGKAIPFSDLLEFMLGINKPLIAAVNGAAFGGGIGLVAASDIIIADEAAKIGDPHVKVGLVAGDGGALIWPQLIGYAKAKELLMTGDLLSAEEAKELGLINYAVPAEQLDAKVAELTGKILANPKWAVRWTKSVTNIPLRALAAQLMDASVGWESVSNYLDDRKEAVAAFKEKRAAKLTGE